MKRRRFFGFTAKALAITSVAGPAALIGSRLVGPLTGTLELARRTLPRLSSSVHLHIGDGWRYIVTQATVQAGPHRGRHGIAAWYQGPQDQIRHFVEGLR